MSAIDLVDLVDDTFRIASDRKDLCAEYEPMLDAIECEAVHEALMALAFFAALLDKPTRVIITDADLGRWLPHYQLGTWRHDSFSPKHPDFIPHPFHRIVMHVWDSESSSWSVETHPDSIHDQGLALCDASRPTPEGLEFTSADAALLHVLGDRLQAFGQFSQTSDAALSHRPCPPRSSYSKAVLLYLYRLMIANWESASSKKRGFAPRGHDKDRNFAIHLEGDRFARLMRFWLVGERRETSFVSMY